MIEAVQGKGCHTIGCVSDWWTKRAAVRSAATRALQQSSVGKKVAPDRGHMTFATNDQKNDLSHEKLSEDIRSKDNVRAQESCFELSVRRPSPVQKLCSSLNRSRT